MSVTSVRLQADLEQGLERVARSQQRSKGWVINQALREYLEREANADERWQQTLKALDDVASGRIVRAKDVHAWLRTWGTPGESGSPKSGR